MVSYQNADGSLLPASRVKEIIGEYLDGRADWRQRKAEEYPDDKRNQRSADGISELAAYVRALPEDDERLRELSQLAIYGDVFSPFESQTTPGHDAATAIGRFRFTEFAAHKDCSDFLTEIISQLTDDKLEWGHEVGEIPDDDAED
jgi:hypothetical protein